MKRMQLVVFLSVVMLALTASLILFSSRTSRVQPTQPPFVSYSELVAAIHGLPMIGNEPEPLRDQWNQYVSVAKRMKVTAVDDIKTGIGELADGRRDPLANIKMMILLRVCFECPKDEWPSDMRGGWFPLSESQMNAKKPDVNWPVGRTGHGFFLQDTIGGYMGNPYNAVAEFEWMVAHCKWRDL